MCHHFPNNYPLLLSLASGQSCQSLDSICPIPCCVGNQGWSLSYFIGEEKGRFCYCLAIKQSKYKTSKFGKVNTGHLLACFLVILLTVSFCFCFTVFFPNVFLISLEPATGASQGFPQAAAPVGVFARGTTRISWSLSCGAREVKLFHSPLSLSSRGSLDFLRFLP